MRYFLLLSSLLCVISCKEQLHQQPSIFEKNSGFDIELINFNENISKLYSKHILNDEDVEYDSIRDGKLSDTILKYKISNLITESMNFKVPQKDLGYNYKSPEIDSIAKFQNTYFNKISILTNLDKKPIAFYAETEFKNLELQKQLLNDFKKKYGKPKYSFFISHEFNQCSYEWDLKDRIIQIETSDGMKYEFSSDGKTKDEKYHNVYMLIIDKKHKTEIHQAHFFKTPEKINFQGKLHSYKDFQFEKEMTFKDNYLLNSTNQAYIKDEYGEYNINNLEEK